MRAIFAVVMILLVCVGPGCKKREKNRASSATVTQNENTVSKSPATGDEQAHQIAQPNLSSNSSEGDVATIRTFQDWRVACPAASNKDVNCELSTDVVDRSQSTSNTVARVRITTNKGGKQMLTFMLPYGVALEAGMGLRIGENPVKVYQYRTCNTIGCLAETPFDAALASSLNDADDAAVMFAALNGKPISVPMSFKGFKAALSNYLAAEAKRGGDFRGP